MKFAKIKAIYKKEILDLLRDKKTLIMMVLVPLLLYPLIMMVALFVVSAVSNNVQSSEYKIAIQEKESVQYDRNKFVEMLESKEDELEYNLKVVESTDLEKQLLEEEIDAYITVANEGEKIAFEVGYRSYNGFSEAFLKVVGMRPKQYAEKYNNTQN